MPTPKVLALVMVVATLAMSSPLRAEVNLEWRPAAQAVCVNDTVEIGLYVVSDDATDQTVGAISVILLWDPTQLELLGKEENGPYAWMSSEFPDDSALDGLNAPFTGPSPFVPDNDGDANFVAWAPFAPSPPAIAVPDGLLVVTFVFRLLVSETGQIEIPRTFGTFTVTAVFDGEVPGLNVTGQISGPATIGIGCLPPAVSAVGSRYLEVTPAPCEPAVALVLMGGTLDPSVSCVSQYLQSDGSLNATPFFQTPALWGNPIIRDAKIRPDTTYQVQAECDLGGEAVPSVATTVTTWVWADADGNGRVDLDDILLTLNGFQGIFGSATLENVD